MIEVITAVFGAIPAANAALLDIQVARIPTARISQASPVNGGSAMPDPNPTGARALV